MIVISASASVIQAVRSDTRWHCESTVCRAPLRTDTMYSNDFSRTQTWLLTKPMMIFFNPPLYYNSGAILVSFAECCCLFPFPCWRSHGVHTHAGCCRFNCWETITRRKCAYRTGVRFFFGWKWIKANDRGGIKIWQRAQWLKSSWTKRKKICLKFSPLVGLKVGVLHECHTMSRPSF